jgi:hypothetical protein
MMASRRFTAGGQNLNAECEEGLAALAMPKLALKFQELAAISLWSSDILAASV